MIAVTDSRELGLETEGASITAARAQLAQGNEAGALALACEVLKNEPQSFHARILLGELALTKGGGPLAEQMGREAVGLRPGDPQAVRLLAEALLVQSRLKEAADLLVPFVKKNPTDWASLLVLAKVAERAGNLTAAVAALRMAVRSGPSNSSAPVLLGELLRRSGNLREAGEILERAIRVPQADLRAWLELARVREAEGDFPAARSALSDALERDPESSDVAGLLGDLLKRNGRLREALVMHRRAAGFSADDLPDVGEHPHVVFVVQQGTVWANLASIYDAFKADPSWKTTVVGLPFHHSQFTTDAERNSVFEFFTEIGIRYVRWDDFRLEPGCADAIFLQLPYEDTLPPGWKNDDLLRAVPRLIYVPYGFVVGAGEENAQGQFNLPLQQRAWMVCAPGGQNKSLFARHCATGDAHVVVTGNPKTDALRDLESVRDEEFEQFAEGRKIVFWNPHFDLRPSGNPFGTGYSTFFRWEQFLLEEFARRRDVAFVIRPHPLFLSSLEKRNLWSGAQVEDFLRRAGQAGNILVDWRPSYLAIFAAATAMISDASSLLVEFATTGKPLLYLRNPHGPGLNETGDFVRDHGATAETELEISCFLDAVAAGPDPRMESRRRAAAELIYRPPHGAGRQIKTAVEARLTTEAAETALPASASLSPNI